MHWVTSQDILARNATLCQNESLSIILVLNSYQGSENHYFCLKYHYFASQKFDL